MASTEKKKKKVTKKKRSLMERINPFDKESKERRAAKKRMKASKRMSSSKKAKGTGLVSTKKSRAKAIGAKAGTKVRRGAVKKVSTKGGDFVKYEKKSKAAKSFRSAFAENCKGKSAGATFTWDGRSYSCGKRKAKKPITRGGEGGNAPE